MDLADVLAVGEAFSGLGWSVERQLGLLIDGPGSDGYLDLNPHAVNLIEERFLPVVSGLDDELGEQLAQAISAWREEEVA